MDGAGTHHGAKVPGSLSGSAVRHPEGTDDREAGDQLIMNAHLPDFFSNMSLNSALKPCNINCSHKIILALLSQVRIK